MPKTKTPEQFIAQSPIGERLSKEVLHRHLAGGVLRPIEINGEAQSLRKLGNNEAKVAEVLGSGYFGVLRTNPDFIEAEIADLVIDEEDVPESYFALQKRIARERGYGEIEFTNQERRQRINDIQRDQRASLKVWANYLRNEGGGSAYPGWFRAYVWESLKRMGDFDKQKGEFKRRTKSTTAPWPELNAEALTYVYDAINTGVVQGVASDSDQLNKLLGTGNFAKLYVHAITEVGVGGSPELREITKGSWVKYDQIEGTYEFPDDWQANINGGDESIVDSTALELARSLRGMHTGWCTAHAGMAAHQLSKGDFYVYYGQDENGQNTIPLAAIRMYEGSVLEVRGVAPGQALGDSLVDIVGAKLATLPGGMKYEKKVADMKWLTDLHDRHMSPGNEQLDLAVEDLAKLYYIDYKVEGFGSGDDPRIHELRAVRDKESDLQRIFEDPRYREVRSDIDLSYMTTIKSLKFPRICAGEINLENVVSIGELVLPQFVGGDVKLGKMKEFDHVKCPEVVFGSLYIGDVEDARGMELPRKVTGTLETSSLKGVDGVVFPDLVDFLDLEGLESARGLRLPRELQWLTINVDSFENVRFPRKMKSLNLRAETLDGCVLPDEIESLYININSLDRVRFTQDIGRLGIYGRGGSTIRNLEISGKISEVHIFGVRVIEDLILSDKVKSVDIEAEELRRVQFPRHLRSLKSAARAMRGCNMPSVVYNLELPNLESTEGFMMRGGRNWVLNEALRGRVTHYRSPLGAAALNWATKIGLRDRKSDRIIVSPENDIEYVRS